MEGASSHYARKVPRMVSFGSTGVLLRVCICVCVTQNNAAARPRPHSCSCSLVRACATADMVMVLLTRSFSKCVHARSEV